MRGSSRGARPAHGGACILALLAASCTGSISDPGAPPGAGPGPGGGVTGAGGGNGMVSAALCRTAAAAGPIDPGPAISRRLTRTEYDNTVLALLGNSTAPARAFPGEELGRNFDNNPQLLSVGAVLAQGYFDAAEAVAAAAVAGDLGALVGPCAATGGAVCAAEFVRAFGARAFRRPLADEEVTRLLRPYAVGAETDFRSGIRLIVTAVLQSAPFLYRLEAGGATAGKYLRPTSYEMASRLSYLLWKSMPDDALFAAAAADQLQTAASVRAQAERMLADGRTQSMVVDFHDQWLDLRAVPALEKDPGAFPGFDETVAVALHAEAEALIRDVAFGGGGSGDLTRLLTVPHTFVNADLARFYGAPAVSGTALQKVTLDGGARSGILTLGGVMAVGAKSNRTSAVLRGAYVRQQILCEDLPAPPPNIPDLPEISPTATARERLAAHEVGGCVECHRLMRSDRHRLRELRRRGAVPRHRRGRSDARHLRRGADLHDHRSGGGGRVRVARRPRRQARRERPADGLHGHQLVPLRQRPTRERRRRLRALQPGGGLRRGGPQHPVALAGADADRCVPLPPAERNLRRST